MNKVITFICIALLVLSGTGAILFLQKGSEGTPIIEPDITGMQDFTYVQGEQFPDLKDDIRGTETVVQVTVDISQVNLSKEGDYDVLYHYTDTSGQEYEKKVTCTVITPPDRKEKEDKDAVAKSESAALKSVADPVRTGDAEEIAGYIMVCVISQTVLIGTFIYRYSMPKKI